MQHSISIKSNLKGVLRNLTESNTSPAAHGLKQLTTILKQNSALVGDTFDILISQLKLDDSQIRFTVFNVMEHLFSRSRIFRDLFVTNLKLILQLTTGIQTNISLPEPKIFAEKLRAKSLILLEKWKNSYGMHYPRLRVAFKYVQILKNRNTNIQIPSNIHQIQQNYQERIVNAMIEKEVAKITYEMPEVFSNTDEMLQECNACFELLIPKLNEIEFTNISGNICSEIATEEILSQTGHLNRDEHETPNISSTSSQIDTQTLFNSDRESHGNRCTELESLPNTCDDLNDDNSDSDLSDSDGDDWEDITVPYSPVVKEYSEHLYKDFRLEIDLSEQKMQITLSSDNECIIEKLLNCLKTLILRFKPLISKWIVTLGKSENSDLLSTVIPYKTKINNIIEKAKLLEIFDPVLNLKSSLLNNLLVKVEDKLSKTILTAESGFEPFDPTSFQAQIHNNPCLTDNISEITAERNDPPFPKFYNEDLSYWEKGEKITQLPRYEGYHTYWVSEPETDLPSDAAIGMLKNRTFTYCEEYEPVLHTCDAAIGNGKFCKRKDRIKCPFHGYIVPRNNLEETNTEPAVPYMEEGIVSFIGEDNQNLRNILTKINNKKQRKKGLVNHKISILRKDKLKNSKRRKLERILFNKRQLLKASELLKSQMLTKNEANFVYNFNYSLKP